MKNALKKGWLKKLLALAATYGVVQLLISVGIVNDYLQATLATICINMVLAVSLNLITGFTGQFSLGHAGFMSIGAYVCGIITLGTPTLPGFLLGVLAGAVVAAVVGCLVGLPTLRLRGDYLAIATLGMSEIIRIVFLNLEVTNGAAGLNGIPQFINWTWLFIFTAGTILLIVNFLHSSHGRACISIREDEIAAESMGVNTTYYKLFAFVLAAFFAGIAGGLAAHQTGMIDPSKYDFNRSVEILIMVVLGGMGSITGSVISASVLTLLPELLRGFDQYRMLVYSIILILVMLFKPSGLLGRYEISIPGLFHKLMHFIRKRKSGKEGV